MRTRLRLRTHAFYEQLTSCAGMILFGLRRGPF
jgi:hypothetical protein